MDTSSLKGAYQTQLPNLPGVDSTLRALVDLEGHVAFAEIDPAANLDLAYTRDHAFAVARLLQQRLSSTDPLLISDFGLGALHGTLGQVYNQLRGYADSKNPVYLAGARTALDQTVYPAMWALFPEAGSGPLDQAQIEAIRLVAARAREAVSEVATKREAELSSAKEAMDKTLESVTSAHQLALEQAEQRFAGITQKLASDEQALRDLSDQITQQRAENAATVARIQKEVAESEQLRGERFGMLLAQQADDFATRSKSVNSDADALILDLRTKNAEVLRLVQAMGVKGITANYTKIAESELKAADRWRLWTIIIFGLGVGAATYVFYKFLDGPLDHMNLGEVALRFGFALAITTPAFYTARESARHRTTGDRARQSEMELASLGPFIANLERDSQDSIRRDLVAKYFGQQQDAHSAVLGQCTAQAADQRVFCDPGSPASVRSPSVKESVGPSPMPRPA